MFQRVNNEASADRFIANRATTDLEFSSYQLQCRNTAKPRIYCNNEKMFCNLSTFEHRRKIYNDTLWSTIFGAPKKILNFSDSKLSFREARKAEHVSWPVRSRKKTLIDAPALILDMPGVQSNIYHHMIDWGRCGYLASVYNSHVTMWNPETENESCEPETIKFGQSGVDYHLRWNNAGTKLAGTLRDQGMGILETEVKKCLVQAQCQCHLISTFTNKGCKITCLTWAPEDKFLLSGCSNGRLSIWDFRLKQSHTIYHRAMDSIVNITFSHDGKYCVTVMISGEIRVWYEPLMSLRSNVIIMDEAPKTVAWHPWKEALFAVPDNANGLLYLFNAGNARELRMLESFPIPSQYGPECHTVSWNKLSGELVASYGPSRELNLVNSHNSDYAIKVYSNMQTEVDSIQWHEGAVPYLLWNPGGNLLATAGLDENLCIWDFFGKKYVKPKSRKRKSELDPCIR